MTSNIFVAQTFNGEKMVNAGSRKPTLNGNSTVSTAEETEISPTEQTTTTAPTPTPTTATATPTAAAPTPTPTTTSVPTLAPYPSPANVTNPVEILPHPPIAPAPESSSEKTDTTPVKETRPYQGRVHDIAVNRQKVARTTPQALQHSTSTLPTSTTFQLTMSPLAPAPPQTSLAPPPPPPPPQQQQQQQQQLPITTAPIPLISQQQTIVRLPYQNTGNSRPRYWSEADTAILIQLHRKHHPAIELQNADKRREGWAMLTTEFNHITGESYTPNDIIRRWDQLIAKYHAERAHLVLQRQAASLQPQPMHVPSYWSHYQYMDLYLNYLPLPNNALDLDEPQPSESPRSQQVESPVQNNEPKRKRQAEEDDNDDYDRFISKQLFETQRLFMERTLNEQASQINMIKQNYEHLSKMNEKYMSLCEKLLDRAQATDDRYLALFEKLKKDT